MNRARFQEIAARFPALRLLVVGDLMLDEFIWGKVRRISPEAPVPVVEVTRETAYPGGAANVARNLQPFAGEIHLLGLVGADSQARVLKGLLERERIRLELLVEDPASRTIVKTRIVARNQQVVRVDREQKTGFSLAQTAAILEQLDRILPEIDGVILEDYAKGLLTQDFARAIIAKARAAGKIVAVDPNPGNPLDWSGVTTVKPNRSEAFTLVGIPESDPVEPVLEDGALRQVGERLLEKWQIESLLVTLSEQGILLFQRDGDIFHIPTHAQEVFDVSGAGDTAIALYTLALCAGASFREAAQLANRAAELVVGKLGTATLTPAELLASFAA